MFSHMSETYSKCGWTQTKTFFTSHDHDMTVRNRVNMLSNCFSQSHERCSWDLHAKKWTGFRLVLCKQIIFFRHIRNLGFRHLLNPSRVNRVGKIWDGVSYWSNESFNSNNYVPTTCFKHLVKVCQSWLFLLSSQQHWLNFITAVVSVFCQDGVCEN